LHAREQPERFGALRGRERGYEFEVVAQALDRDPQRVQFAIAPTRERRRARVEHASQAFAHDAIHAIAVRFVRHR